MIPTGSGNRPQKIVGVNITFLVLATVISILRCYVRVRLLRAFGVDDWLMSAAMVAFALYCGFQLAGVSHGTGRHAADLTKEDESRAKMWWWWCYISYSVTMLLAKLSIGWFLLRVAVNRTHRRIIYLGIALSVVSLPTFFFFSVFQCWPVSYFWDKYTQTGKCIHPDVIAVMAYLMSVVSIISDLIFALLPAWIVSHLNMKLKSKVALIALMTLGCIASAAVVVRLPFVQFLDSDDFLYDTSNVAIMSTVEQGLAIAAGGLSTLQPLVKLIGYKLGLASHPGLPGSSGHGGLHAGGTISVRRSISRRTDAFGPIPYPQNETELKLQPGTSGYLAKCYNTSQEELTGTVNSDGKMSKESEINLVRSV